MTLERPFSILDKWQGISGARIARCRTPGQAATTPTDRISASAFANCARCTGCRSAELAKRAGVTNGTISLIEQSRISPSIGSLKKVLGGFPISIADFLTLDMSPRAKVFYQAKDLREIAARRRLLPPRRTRHARPRDPDDA